MNCRGDGLTDGDLSEAPTLSIGRIELIPTSKEVRLEV